VGRLVTDAPPENFKELDADDTQMKKRARIRAEYVV
jgi:hypothetical protein